ncbi:hypothetical protein ACOJIV_18075 [Haloarcula sp. AONF1]
MELFDTSVSLRFDFDHAALFTAPPLALFVALPAALANIGLSVAEVAIELSYVQNGVLESDGIAMGSNLVNPTVSLRHFDNMPLAGSHLHVVLSRLSRTVPCLSTGLTCHVVFFYFCQFEVLSYDRQLMGFTEASVPIVLCWSQPVLSEYMCRVVYLYIIAH